MEINLTGLKVGTTIVPVSLKERPDVTVDLKVEVLDVQLGLGDVTLHLDTMSVISPSPSVFKEDAVIRWEFIPDEGLSESDLMIDPQNKYCSVIPTKLGTGTVKAKWSYCGAEFEESARFTVEPKFVRLERVELFPRGVLNNSDYLSFKYFPENTYPVPKGSWFIDSDNVRLYSDNSIDIIEEGEYDVIFSYKQFDSDQLASKVEKRSFTHFPVGFIFDDLILDKTYPTPSTRLRPGLKSGLTPDYSESKFSFDVSVSDESVLRVIGDFDVDSNSYEVEILKEGSVTITAYYQGDVIEKTFEIKRPALERISVQGSPRFGAVQEDFEMVIETFPEGSILEKPNYWSNNSQVADFNEWGTLIARSPGKANVYVASDNPIINDFITFEVVPKSLNSIGFEEDRYNVYRFSERKVIPIKFDPEDFSIKEVKASWLYDSDISPIYVDKESGLIDLIPSSMGVDVLKIESIFNPEITAEVPVYIHNEHILVMNIFTPIKVGEERVIRFEVNPNNYNEFVDVVELEALEGVDITLEKVSETEWSITPNSNVNGRLSYRLKLGDRYINGLTRYVVNTEGSSAPTITEDLPDRVYGIVGGEISLVVKTSNSPVDFMWMVGDDIVQEDFGVTSGESILNLKDLNGSHERFYKVRLTDPETGDHISTLCEILISDPNPA